MKVFSFFILLFQANFAFSMPCSFKPWACAKIVYGAYEVCLGDSSKYGRNTFQIKTAGTTEVFTEYDRDTRDSSRVWVRTCNYNDTRPDKTSLLEEIYALDTRGGSSLYRLWGTSPLGQEFRAEDFQVLE